MLGYLITNNKDECCGCYACEQICPTHAITMSYDAEKFSYPNIDLNKCIQCKLCEKVCPISRTTFNDTKVQKAFGGYNLDENIRKNSTSGGAFNAIAKTFCDENYVIFGAKTVDLSVVHDFVTNIDEIGVFQKSKYVQSNLNDAFRKTKSFLNGGKKVLFSGTPCQIAGLKKFLKHDYVNLLTVEVICEGVPSPLYIEKFATYLEEKYNKPVINIDYRNKDKKKWDFQVMKVNFQDGSSIKKDRWFNPFWNIWLNHVMSRPSCYECPFAKRERVADITLGDLWGVHLYCQDLYGNNGGATLMISNTSKGLNVLNNLDKYMFYRELDINTSIKYQSPMRKKIEYNMLREEFMKDLKTNNYKFIVKKWSKNPNLKLLFNKYVWGNRQKIFVWKLKQKIMR